MLCNVLAQNPALHVTATSGLADLLFGVRTQWNQVPELLREGDAALRRVMQSVLRSFHGSNKVVLDKSRGWVSEIELVEDLLGRSARIIAPVRDIRDVLSSFEKLWRRNYFRLKPTDKMEYLQCQTVEGRCHFWLGTTSPLGIAYGRLVDALHRGFADRMLFVHHERFTASPQEELDRIYQFLELPSYQHNFDNIVQVTQDDDDLYGMGDLHTIRSKLVPSTPQWPAILGEFATDFGRFNFQ